MKLQAKAVIAFNVFIVLVCVIMGFLGYKSAANGLDTALQRTARSNIKLIIDIMEFHYPGEWIIKNGQVYKGETLINDNNDMIDHLGTVCEGHVTFFKGDTRIAKTIKEAGDIREVGTRAAENLEITSSDEIGTLSRDVNEMKEKLRKLLINVLQSCEKVATSSQELTASAEQTSESINNVANNTVAMAEYASKQSETVEKLQVVVDNMGAKMDELHLSAKKGRSS